ncbi:MAG: glycosyltransferase family 1 protein, partial [Actinomycetota bacterium]|nr:glycosyltransferase family 1 protein [Actinomycetota bacterium]
PYGTVYGEALAMGLPLAGWRAGNLPHLAEDGREAVLAPPADIAALAAGLHRLACDQDFRERLRQGAKARGRLLPTWEDSARRFFQVLHLMARPHPR